MADHRTRLIQKLETHLAVKLLHRTTRNISVTTVGAAYYERCVRILEDIEEAEHLWTRHNNSPCGTLTVDTTSRLAKMVFMLELHNFFNAYPELELELTSNGKPIDLLKEGVDVVVRIGALEESMGGPSHWQAEIRLPCVAHLFAALRHT